MAKESRFWNYVLIVVFSSAVVALGAEEIYRRESSRARALKVDVRELFRTLRGETPEMPLERARISPNSISSSSGVRRNSSGEAVSLQQQEKDELNRKDRNELENLVDELMP